MYCGFSGRGGEGALRGADLMPGDRHSCPGLRPGDLEVIGTSCKHVIFDFACHNGPPSGNDVLNGIGPWGEWMDGWSWPISLMRIVNTQFCDVGGLPIASGVHETQLGEIDRGLDSEGWVERL